MDFGRVEASLRSENGGLFDDFELNLGRQSLRACRNSCSFRFTKDRLGFGLTTSDMRVCLGA